MINLFCLLFLFVSEVSSNTYNRFPVQRQVKVKWYIVPGAEEIFFWMQSPLKNGYVGMGLNSKSSMTNADIVVCWIDDNGTVHLEDRHATGYFEPIKDEHQDYQLISADNKNGYLTCEFKRKIKTCDKNDFTFSQTHAYLLFAYSENSPTKTGEDYYLDPHGPNNHFTSKEYFLNTGTALLEGLDRPVDTTATFNISYKGFVIPERVTTYWCQVFEIPEEYQKTPHYFIGWRPMITPGHEKYFHHAGLGQCRGDSVKLKQEVAKGGWDCSTTEEFMKLIGCIPILASFVVGSQGEIYPDDIAYGFGLPAGGSNFLFYQTHYNNDGLDKGVVDSSGLSLFLTNKKRQHLAGTLLSLTPTDYHMAAAPGQKAFMFPIICPPLCTNLYGSEGVTAFGLLPHMHLSGRKYIVRHFGSDGVEKPPIFEDHNYLFDSQESVMLSKRVKILPGESLITECHLDTSDRNETVVGGLSVFDEMCSNVLYVYPVQPEFSVCTFGVPEEDERKFIGVKEFDEKTKTFKEPMELKGKTMDEAVKKFKWTDQKAKEFQELVLQKKFGYCLGIAGKQLLSGYAKVNVTKEYEKPKDDCKC